MFDYFRKAKTIEIKALRRLEESGRFPAPWRGRRPDFRRALERAAKAEGLAVIAEYKRASPSQGDIALAVSPQEAARAYLRSGASALSVLTEKSRFKGRLGFVNRAWSGLPEGAELPILRKDFIFDRLQVRATAGTAASAVLLIVGLTPAPDQLRALRLEAAAHGLQCVVEVTGETELELARRSGAKLIQVNARDFHDLSVDLDRSLDLARRRGPGADELWIAASGFSRPDQLAEARAAGYRAVLVGTALMRGGDPGAALARLRGRRLKAEERP